MAPINPPSYLQAGTYSARSDRLLLAAHMAPDDGVGPLAMRSGVRPRPAGSALQVAQRSSPSMFVTVGAGSAFIQSSASAGGGYLVVNDAPHDLAIPAAHATLGRRDIVVARIYDAEVAGSTNQWALEVISGTPAGSPTAPSAPSGALLLATVLVNAATTQILNAAITDGRVYTTALGGTTPAPAGGLPASPYTGMAAYDTTNLKPTWFNGTSWHTWNDDPATKGFIKCTSTTRPTPADGMAIYETDTSRAYIYATSISTWAEIYLDNRPRAVLARTTNTNLGANYNSGLNVSWTQQVAVTPGMHSLSTNPSRVTVPRSGYYAVSLRVYGNNLAYQITNPPARLGLQIATNPSNDQILDFRNLGYYADQYANLSGILYCAAGGYVSATVYVDGNAAGWISGERFSVIWLGT